MKKNLVMLTAYDYPTAKIIDAIGLDYILVGDSVGMVVYGYPDTKSVTVADMVRHVGAVARGAKNTKIIADLPFGSYATSTEAVKNATLLLEAGANGVKIEGRNDEIMNRLTSLNIPVMGHLGLLPQTAKEYRLQGKDKISAQQIYSDALVLDHFQLLALILECIPHQLAKKISDNIQVPTIGIGAGKDCNGQVLVLHDIIGLSDFHGKFVRQYADNKRLISEAVLSYKNDVISHAFPSSAESFL